jgi:TolA protein
MRTRLEARRKALTDLRTVAATSLTSLNRERATLETKQGETNVLVDRLKREGGELQAIMARRQREASALDAELDRIVAEEARKAEAKRREAERLERERQAKLEAEAKQREAEAARKEAEDKRQREAEAAAIAKQKKDAEAAEAAAREAEKAAKTEADRKAAEKAAEKAANDKKKAEEAEAKRLKREAEKAARAAEEKKREAEKAAEREQTKKGKPVQHKGKNNRYAGESSSTGTSGTTATNVTPTLKGGSTTGESGVAPAVETPVGSNFESYKGRLPMPVSGSYTIVKRFGRQQHPTLPHVEITNSGIDLATATGASVRAVFDGEVSAVFRPDGYNNVVVIRHGRYMTVYANLGSLNVATGQKVKAGQTIGTVYADPNDNNRSVLHFEIRNQRQKENPEAWLKR